jgi:peroxiredoxin
MYLVSCGGQDDDPVLDQLRADTQAFLESRNVELPTYADQNAVTRRALATLLQLEDFVYPTTMVVDRQGRIRGFWTGYDARAVGEMKAVIEALLERKQ